MVWNSFEQILFDYDNSSLRGNLTMTTPIQDQGKFTLSGQAVRGYTYTIRWKSMCWCHSTLLSFSLLQTLSNVKKTHLCVTKTLSAIITSDLFRVLVRRVSLVQEQFVQVKPDTMAAWSISSSSSKVIKPVNMQTRKKMQRLIAARA